MNEIEQKFYDAYEATEHLCDIEPQAVIGIYRVDFLVGGLYAVEIDGHEFHKTKEQREADYKRERYFIRRGYVPIRFTGTEVFLEADKCVHEIDDIVETLHLKEIDTWDRTMSIGRCGISKDVRTLFNDEFMPALRAIDGFMPKLRAILDSAKMPPEKEDE